jgi:hypothetical protein
LVFIPPVAEQDFGFPSLKELFAFLRIGYVGFSLDRSDGLSCHKDGFPFRRIKAGFDQRKHFSTSRNRLNMVVIPVLPAPFW